MKHKNLGFGQREESVIEQLVGKYVLVGSSEGKYAAKLQGIDHTGETLVVTDALMLISGDREVTPRGPVQFPISASVVPITEENYRAVRNYMDHFVGMRGHHILVGDKVGGLVEDISGMGTTLNPSVKVMPGAGWKKGGRIYQPHDPKDQIVRVEKSYLAKLVNESKKERARREAMQEIEEGELKLRKIRLEQALAEAEKELKRRKERPHRRVTKK